MRIKICFVALGLLIFSALANGQTKAPDNWFNKDLTKDGVLGMSTEEAYAQLRAKGKKGKTIIVAVLDSGVDWKHEDLKDVMWTNPGEIPNDGKDNDGNGYVDDVHGWNFIGGPDGQNVEHETLELAREYGRLSKIYAAGNKTGNDKEYKYWLEVKTNFEEKRGELEAQVAMVNKFFKKAEDAFAQAAKALGKSKITPEDLPALKKLENNSLAEAIPVIEKCFSQEITPENLEEQKKEATEYFDGQLQYGMNPDFDSRKIVKDNYNDFSNRIYGNNDVTGPDASHGTHVAGIIAARRGNGVGMDGVAENVKIMAVRAVPDGDERDKDVANGIRYAVDNGACIINMSFGKGYSPNKEYVDDAVRYALAHDVLLVHAAGNDSEDNDADPNFPNDKFAKKGGLFKSKTAANWMEIGALSWKPGEKRPASFSNYGKKNVDLFSPGVAIYSTTPDNKYASFQGTSMASPAAAGVAAMLRSYFPDLSATQVKKIMMGSVVAQTGKVYKPGTQDLVEFSDLCTTGGVASASKAVDAAEKVKGKKVKKAKWRMAGEKAEKVKSVIP